ncbi:unnamed protein product, partial [Effrenium voratum]
QVCANPQLLEEATAEESAVPSQSWQRASSTREDVPDATPGPYAPARTVTAPPRPEATRFKANAWAKRRGAGGGQPGGREAAHYFDSPAPEDPPPKGGGGFYFAEEPEPPRTAEPPNARGANPYFSKASEECASCGSSNTGRRMCFDCGAERQEAPARAPQMSRSAVPGTTAAPPKQAQAFCTACGAQQLRSAKFCAECGSRMDAGPPVPSQGLQGSANSYFDQEEEQEPSFQDLRAQLKKEALQKPVQERGVGAYIRSCEGELWGRVVADQGRSWQLASGRSAKKENEGKVWFFDAKQAHEPTQWTENVQSASVRAPSTASPPYAAPRVSVLDGLAEKRRQEEEALHAKREAARRRRHQDEERRVDPDDNKSYTWEELRARYCGMFSEKELLEYWNKDCKPAQPKSGAAGQSEKRRDPEDGQLYSFDELTRKYRGTFTLTEIEGYWLEECRR